MKNSINADSRNEAKNCGRSESSALYDDSAGNAAGGGCNYRWSLIRLVSIPTNFTFSLWAQIFHTLERHCYSFPTIPVQIQFRITLSTRLQATTQTWFYTTNSSRCYCNNFQFWEMFPRITGPNEKYPRTETRGAFVLMINEERDCWSSGCALRCCGELVRGKGGDTTPTLSRTLARQGRAYTKVALVFSMPYNAVLFVQFVVLR